MKNTNYFAQYGCGTYGGGAYDHTGCATTSNPSDSLANTGYDVLIPIFIGIAVVVASGILLVRRILRKRKNAQATL
ncbi:MAG TPA: hypothetical protein VLG40_02225 [Candidatus Saccharimonas sp.]|nr:hypothetical protein [Candidatus Saccharimonas sp.]